ncbi:hypothetical protein PR048_015500 [Dryococelus australis]|uniref:Uncharacterized protein n=1 Tax=Dryococelus australis TaxID=614101 RepID=A0ABQ9HH36_9NEOP|nr:hypothetical protein PR048_015500 [Dryococelus australis]
MSEKCFICDRDLNNGGQTVVVTKGMSGLVAASQERGDGKEDFRSTLALHHSGDADTTVAAITLQYDISYGVKVMDTDMDILAMLTARGDGDTHIEVHHPFSGKTTERFSVYLLFSGTLGHDNYATLDELRVYLYTCKVAKLPVSASFQLATLPPTSAACEQHSLLAYLQVQDVSGTLVPITISLPPAPEQLLNVIACNCKSDCSYRCECVQTGLQCGIMCAKCRGATCTNVVINIYKYTLTPTLRGIAFCN